MPKSSFKDKVLDARPDCLDLRDREYRPKLCSLLAQYPSENELNELLPCYTAPDRGMQGQVCNKARHLLS